MFETTATLTEAEYSNRARVPEHPAIFARWAAHSTAARTLCGRQMQTLAYGDHPRQAVDLFTAAKGESWLVFVHGGYWRSLSKDDFSWLAPPWLAQGVNVAVINYRLCPEVGIAAIIEDVAAAIRAIAAQPAFAEARRCALVGHSAGGHLVATMASLGREHLGLLPHVSIRVLPVSALFDLTPLLMVSMNDDLHLDRVSANALSPVTMAPPIDIRLEVFVGGAESSEFIRQSELLGKAWPNAVPFDVRITGANHFNVLDDLVASDGIMASRLHDFFYPTLRSIHSVLESTPV